MMTPRSTPLLEVELTSTLHFSFLCLSLHDNLLFIDLLWMSPELVREQLPLLLASSHQQQSGSRQNLLLPFSMNTPSSVASTSLATTNNRAGGKLSLAMPSFNDVGRHSSLRMPGSSSPPFSHLVRFTSRDNLALQRADVYALGIVLYEIMGRKGPYGNCALPPKGQCSTGFFLQ